MENASKALLIAASVLIAILLIAMAVRVLTSTQGTVSSTEETMKTAEVTTFNNKFTAYLGTQSNEKAKNLANIILANNKNSNRTVLVSYCIFASKKVSYTSNENSSGNDISINNIIRNLSDTIYEKVNITVEEYDNEGYIKKIKFDNTEFAKKGK